MPRYDYQSEYGDVIEEFFVSAAEAPDVIMHGGVEYRKRIPRPQNYLHVKDKMREDYAQFREEQRRDGIGENH